MKPLDLVTKHSGRFRSEPQILCLFKVVYNGVVVATKYHDDGCNFTVGTIIGAVCSQLPGGVDRGEVLAYNALGAPVDEDVFVSRLPGSLDYGPTQHSAAPTENYRQTYYLILISSTQPVLRGHQALDVGEETVKVGNFAREITWKWRAPDSGFGQEEDEEDEEDGAAAAVEGDDYHKLPIDVFKIVAGQVTSPVLMLAMRRVCRAWRNHIDEERLIERFQDDVHTICNHCRQHKPESFAQFSASTLARGISHALTDGEQAAKRARGGHAYVTYSGMATNCLTIAKSVSKAVRALPVPVTDDGKIDIITLTLHPALDYKSQPHTEGVAHALRLYLAEGRAPGGFPLDQMATMLDAQARFTRVAQLALPSVTAIKCVTTHYALFCNDSLLCFEVWLGDDSAYHICQFNVYRAHAALRAIGEVLWENRDLLCNECRAMSAVKIAGPPRAPMQ